MAAYDLVKYKEELVKSIRQANAGSDSVYEKTLIDNINKPETKTEDDIARHLTTFQSALGNLMQQNVTTAVDNFLRQNQIAEMSNKDAESLLNEAYKQAFPTANNNFTIYNKFGYWRDRVKSNPTKWTKSELVRHFTQAYSSTASENFDFQHHVALGRPGIQKPPGYRAFLSRFIQEYNDIFKTNAKSDTLTISPKGEQISLDVAATEFYEGGFTFKQPFGIDIRNALIEGYQPVVTQLGNASGGSEDVVDSSSDSADTEADSDPDRLKDREYIRDIYRMLTTDPVTGGWEHVQNEDVQDVYDTFEGRDIRDSEVYLDLYNFLKDKAIENGELSIPESTTPDKDVSPASASSSAHAGQSYRIVRGDGTRDNSLPLRENGNAAFLVSEFGELFHVSENLANEMIRNGTWREPEVISQEEIKSKAFRGSLTHTAELGVLEIQPMGAGLLLVRGDGASLGNEQLNGNRDAVFAIDRDGNRLHVTEQVAEEMKRNGIWMEPAVLNQVTVDTMPLEKALASASGGLADLSIKVGEPTTLASVAPSSDGNNSAPSTPAAPESELRGSSSDLKLIRGDGTRDNSLPLRENANAVFLVNKAGELFHVTENLMNEMIAAQLWKEPEVVSQDVIKGKTLRTSLNYNAELGVLDIEPKGDFLLVRGNGDHLSTNQLQGNADAVFAIDKNGNKFHVTEAVWNEMQSNNTWMEPAVLNQNTVDQMPVNKALASASGGTIDLSIPLTEVPTASSAQPSTTTSTTPTPSFKLVQGNGRGLGLAQLKNNGAAVYAILPNGTKLHVTEAMADTLKQEHKWTEPEVVNQTELDKTPVAGTLASTSGAVGTLEVPFERFTFVRGDGAGLGTKQLKGNGAAVYALLPDGTKLHVTEAMADTLKRERMWTEPEVVNQTELDKTPVAGTLASTSGSVGPLEIDFEVQQPVEEPRPAAVAAPAPAPAPVQAPEPAFKLVRGNGPGRGITQLKDNGAAVYAILPNGTKLHVTAAMADTLKRERMWTEPEVVNQTELDKTPVAGTLASTSGAVGALEVPFEPTFRLIRGNGAGLGNSQLKGNGAAVYALLPDGTKLHVTEAMAIELKNAKLWRDPEVWDQNTIDQTPPAGSLANIYGGRSGLTIDFIAQQPEPAQQPAPAAPVAAAPVPPPAPVAPPAPVVTDAHRNDARAAIWQFLGRDASPDSIEHHATLLANGTYDSNSLRSALASQQEAVDYRNRLIWETFRLYVVRDPSQGDFDYWQTQLKSGAVTPEQFRIGIVNAPEAQQNQAYVWSTLSPAAQQMYSEAINNIFVTVAGRPATQADVLAHVPGLVNGQTNLTKLQQNIASSIINGSRKVEVGQVLGASTDAPMATTTPSSPVNEENKPEVVGEAQNTDDDNAIWVTDAEGERRDISNLSWEKRAEVQKHIVEGGGSFSQLDKVESIYASGDPTAIDNWERFSQTGKYSPNTPWGATYQSVVKDGYSHELAAAWADGTHADNMKQATTPVNGVVGAAAVSTNGPNMFGVN